MNEQLKQITDAMLTMQRHSWEQGVASHALLAWQEWDLVILMAKEAVNRRLNDGRLAVMNYHAVSDPAANGEALLHAFKSTRDSYLQKSLDDLIEYLVYKAPRSLSGILYHIDDTPQVWIDSLYMYPPFLTSVGYHEEAIAQSRGIIDYLYDKDKKLFSQIYDIENNTFVRKEFWAGGNGWALAGIARTLRTVPNSFKEDRAYLIGIYKEALDSVLSYMLDDGRFYNIIDNTSSFVELNASQMIAYSIYTAVYYGFLSINYIPYANLIRKTADEFVDEFGLVQGVCGAPDFDHPGVSTEGQAFHLMMHHAAKAYEEKFKPKDMI